QQTDYEDYPAPYVAAGQFWSIPADAFVHRQLRTLLCPTLPLFVWQRHFFAVSPTLYHHVLIYPVRYSDQSAEFPASWVIPARSPDADGSDCYPEKHPGFLDTAHTSPDKG